MQEDDNKNIDAVQDVLGRRPEASHAATHHQQLPPSHELRPKREVNRGCLQHASRR